MQLINLKAKINADVISQETGEILSSITMELYLRDLNINADIIKGFELRDYYILGEVLVLNCEKWVE